MEFTDRIRSWLKSSQMRRRPSSATVRCDELSIVLITHSEEETRAELRWDEVNAVYAYKRDCLTMDQICLVLGNEQRGVWIEVREGDEGFKAFLKDLPEKLQGFPAESEWLQKVALPPFETRWAVLYRKVG